MIRTLWVCVGCAICISTPSLADDVGFDQMSGQPGSAWGIPSGGGSIASTGNRFMGVPFRLAGPSMVISGFDTTMINNTGAVLNLEAGWRVSCNYWIWNAWVPGEPYAFADLAGSGSSVFTLDASVSIAPGAVLFFAANQSPGAGVVPPAGTAPGVPIDPVGVSSLGTLGITLNWSIDRRDGAGFVSVGGLSQLVVGGASAVPPSVGGNGFFGSTLGYFRSVAGEHDGNFLNTSARQIGANSGLLLRVYTASDACPADFNQDGGIDGADVDAFFAAWEGGDSSADVNQDGGIDGSDVSTFFAAWEAGGC